MLDIFKGVFTFFRRRSVQTDSFVFRLHHSVTVALLLIFCLIVGFTQYLKRPISCSSSDIPRDVLDVQCWTQSTFTVAEVFQKKIGSGIAYPGVGSLEDKSGEITLHYYPWVFLSLFFQAILFYTPRWLWKNWEGGKLQALRMNLNIGFVSKEEKSQKKELLVDYLHENMNNHTRWSGSYFLCELLTLGNLIAQMFFMDHFLDGHFWSYGPRLLSYTATDDMDRLDPSVYVFPKMVKCIFHKYGASGATVRYDSICVLPLNILNGKIYAFLWFWLIILLTLTSAWLIIAVIAIRSSKFRIYALGKCFEHVNRNVISQIERHCGICDWLLLYMLDKNLDSRIFRDVMEDLADRLGKNNSSTIELTQDF